MDQTDKIANYFLADVNVSTTRTQRIEEIQRILSQVPGVDRVEGWAAAGGKLVLPDDSIGDGVQILGPPVASDLVQPIMREGRWIQPGDQNAITLNEPFAQRLPDLEVGDTLTIQIDGEEEDWTVVGFYQMAGSTSGFLGYTSYHYLADLTGQPRRATEFRVVSDQQDLSLEQQEALGRRIEAALEDNGIDVREMNAGAWLSEISSEGFGIVTAFLLFMSVLTAMVGSIGLAGSLSLNVMERTREIGVMRAIGASNRILVRMVLVEGMSMGFLSWLAGSLMALPVSNLMSNTLSLALFDAPTDFKLTYVGFALWMLTVSLLSVVASLMPALSASRLTIREVLAHE
jgi:putative ABC transport system permease protein